MLAFPHPHTYRARWFTLPLPHVDTSIGCQRFLVITVVHATRSTYKSARPFLNLLPFLNHLLLFVLNVMFYLPVFYRERGFLIGLNLKRPAVGENHPGVRR